MRVIANTDIEINRACTDVIGFEFRPCEAEYLSGRFNQIAGMLGAHQAEAFHARKPTYEPYKDAAAELGSLVIAGVTNYNQSSNDVIVVLLSENMPDEAVEPIMQRMIRKVIGAKVSEEFNEIIQSNWSRRERQTLKNA